MKKKKKLEAKNKNGNCLFFSESKNELGNFDH